jgi:hypothetical protein
LGLPPSTQAKDGRWIDPTDANPAKSHFKMYFAQFRWLSSLIPRRVRPPSSCLLFSLTH